MAQKQKPKKVVSSYTSKGQKVVNYSDGTKTYDGQPTPKTSGSKTDTNTGATGTGSAGGGVTLPDLPESPTTPTAPTQGSGGTKPGIQIADLIGTSLPTVDSTKITKDTRNEFKGFMSGIRNRANTKIRGAQDKAQQQRQALEGQLGTGRRFSSSAQAFLSYIDTENAKVIAEYENQKEEALSAGEFELAGLIEKRIANERSNAQQEFDNISKAYDLLEKQNSAQGKKPENIATSEKQVAVLEAMNGGLTEIEDIFNEVRKTRDDVTFEDIVDALSDMGKNATGGAVDAAMAEKLTGDAKNFLLMKSSFPDYLPTEITSLPEEDQLSAYIQWVEGKGNVSKIGSKPTGTGVSNALPGMSGYESSILISRLTKQIYGKTSSDKESERVEAFVNAGMKAGKSELQIMDDVLGFKVTRNAPLAEKLRNSVLTVTDENGLAGFDMAGLARLINEGQDQQAIQKVEQHLYSQAKNLEGTDYVSETSVRYAKNKADEVRNLVYRLADIELEDGIFSNEPDSATEIDESIGNFSGTMQGWLGKFKSEEAQEIETAIVGLVAEMRNKLSGTAVTDSEKAFLDPLIPQITDKPAIFLKKLQQLVSDPLLKLNSMRETYNLPELDQESLTDYGRRVPAYMAAPTISDDDFFNNPLPASETGENDGIYNPDVWNNAL